MRSSFVEQLQQNSAAWIDRFSSKGDDAAADSALRKLSRFKNFHNRKNELATLRYKSLFIFPPDNKFRLYVFNWVENEWVERAILAMIVVNCIILALDDKDQIVDSHTIHNVELVCIAAFLLEMVLKVIAWGFVLNKSAYLRNGWNLMDFILVSLNVISLIPGTFSVAGSSAIHFLRILRPLQSINGTPRLRQVVTAVIVSLKSMANVLLLAIFLIYIFAALGMQLWSGRLKYRCVRSDTILPVLSQDLTTFCNPSAISSSFIFGKLCEGGSCIPVGNPNWGYANFDTIWWSGLLVFNVITLDNWTVPANLVWDTWSATGVIYFIVLAIFGGYILANMLLAVINEEFNERARVLGQASAQTLLLGHSSLKRTVRMERSKSRVIRRMSRIHSPDFHLNSILEEHRLSNRFYEEESRNYFKEMLQCLNDIIHRISPVKASLFCKRINDSRWFEWVMIGIVLYNIVVLSTQSYQEPLWLNQLQEISNTVLTCFFIIEAVVKILAMGYSYFKDPFLLLDFVIVILSVFEMIFQRSTAATAFRSFRLLRVLKMVKGFNSLRSIVNVLFKTMRDTAALNAIIFLFLFMESLLGQQLFAGAYTTRANFDHFHWSFYTVFQILIRDSWEEVMYNGMAATFPTTALYFISIIVCGSFVLLNMFLAILIKGFQKNPHKALNEHREYVRRQSIGTVGDSVSESDVQSSSDDLESLAADSNPSTESFPEQGDALQPINTGLRSEYTEFETLVSERIGEIPLTSSFVDHVNEVKKLQPLKTGDQKEMSRVAALRRAKLLAMNEFTESAVISRDGAIPRSDGKHAIEAVPSTLMKSRNQLWKSEVFGNDAGGSAFHVAAWGYFKPKLPLRTNGGRSLFLFGPRNKVRLLCTALVTHQPNRYSLGKYFDVFIVCCICLSSALMAVDNPQNRLHPKLSQGLDIVDLIFTSIFITEMLINIIARGFFMGKGAYLRDPWRAVAFVIVCISVVSLLPSNFDFAVVKVIRAFRAVRPLRVIGKTRELKIVIRTILKSVPGMFDVSIIAGLNYILFGILGVQFFSGKLYHCTDPSVDRKDNCVGTYVNSDTISQPRMWKNKYKQNYDNLYQSVLTMFELSNIQGWSAVMYQSIDGAALDRSPILNYNPAACIFFIVFVVVGCFFIFNIFAAVVVTNFQHIKLEMDGVVFVTRDQRRWLETQRIVLNFQLSRVAKVPANRVRRLLYKITISHYFDYAIGLVVFASTIILSMDSYGFNQRQDLWLSIANWVFVGVFALEAILKVLVSPAAYWHDKWNRFDFLLVLLNITDAVLSTIELEILSVNVNALRLFRALRILRVVKLLRQFSRMQVILQTLWYSVPSLLNIGVFLILIYYIFAVLAVNLFGKLNRQEGITIHHNFESCWLAMYTLCSVSTGRTWNTIMRATMATTPSCETNDSCGLPYAPIYFVAFKIASSLILLNMFVAIILDNYSIASEIQRGSLNMTHLAHFVEEWSKIDRKATYTIPSSKLPRLLANLGPPLGIMRSFSRMEILNACKEYGIVDHGGRVHFIEVLLPLARKSNGVLMKEDEMKEQEEGLRRKFKTLAGLPIVRYKGRSARVAEYFAASYIAATYKQHIARRKLQILRLQNRKLEAKEAVFDDTVVIPGSLISR